MAERTQMLASVAPDKETTLGAPNQSDTTPITALVYILHRRRIAHRVHDGFDFGPEIYTVVLDRRIARDLQIR